MIDLYYWPTPNGHKISLFLEESALPYRIVPVDTRKGEQFSCEFNAVNHYSGQPVHFKHFAPKGFDYAVDRYLYEARRHYGILNTQLSKAPFVLGSNYTIADISAWGWVRALPFILGEDVWSAFPHIKTWFDRINERPAARRANALKDRFRFKTEMDEEARRHMFRHASAR
jgi:GST-like protein